MTETLQNITQTIDGYQVKDLRWLPLDNIYVGLVKDPIYGKPNLHDGFVSVQWNKHGKPLKLNKGRIDFSIDVL